MGISKNKKQEYNKEYYRKNREGLLADAKNRYTPHPREKAKTKKCPTCGKIIRRTAFYCRKHAPFSKKHRENISKALKGRPKPYLQGRKRPEHSQCLKNWWKNHPEEREKARVRGLVRTSDKTYLQKLSELLSGENNPNWKGGLAQKKYKGFYQKLKDKIRKRDNYTCQLCGETEKELGYSLSVNHINFDKTDNREENLNALCKRCNSLINFDRKKWTKYFQKKIQISSSIEYNFSSWRGICQIEVFSSSLSKCSLANLIYSELSQRGGSFNK